MCEGLAEASYADRFQEQGVPFPEAHPEDAAAPRGQREGVARAGDAAEEPSAKTKTADTATPQNKASRTA